MMYMQGYLRTAFTLPHEHFPLHFCSKFSPSRINLLAEKCTGYTASDIVLLTNKPYSKFISAIIGLWCQSINLSVSVDVSQFYSLKNSR